MNRKEIFDWERKRMSEKGRKERRGKKEREERKEREEKEMIFEIDECDTSKKTT